MSRPVLTSPRESVTSLPAAPRSETAGEAQRPARDAAAAWAASGAMSLTGHADGPPRLAPAGIALAAQQAGTTLDAWSGSGAARDPIDPAALLSERAAHFGGTRSGRTSVGGHCRLLRTRTGWIALALARPEDRELLPAWLESRVDGDGWATLARIAAGRDAATLVDRARLIGLPVAAAGSRVASPTWRRVVARGEPVAPRPAPARVVDLSSLWAGPLCAQLLARAGADVVKLECTERPDGARDGATGFLDLLHAGKRSVALPFRDAEGRRRLASLLEHADLVVESARPRGLEQLGIDARSWVRGRPGRVWLSITGYGRGDPEQHWVAFGDDAAVAAGLADAVGDVDGPLFCGDAIADPLTGLHAAVAALDSVRAGGGELIDVDLCGVAAHALQLDPTLPSARVVRSAAGARDAADWSGDVSGERIPVAAPRSRTPRGRARPLGADTAAFWDATGRARWPKPVC